MPFDRFRYSAENCSVARTLEIVGEKWTFLVLREAFFGLRRFDDFARVLSCGRAVLTARLAKLVDEGLLRRVPYREEGQRARSEYELTAKGLDLLPAILALMQWGDRWTADPAGPPVEVVHNGCGAGISVTLTCAGDHAPLAATELGARPGPGARLRR